MLFVRRRARKLLAVGKESKAAAFLELKLFVSSMHLSVDQLPKSDNKPLSKNVSLRQWFQSGVSGRKVIIIFNKWHILLSNQLLATLT